MTLAGRHVLVTGATGAIGQAICLALAAEGARVVIHYGHNRAAAETLLDQIGGAGWIVAGDLSEAAGAATSSGIMSSTETPRYSAIAGRRTFDGLVFRVFHWL